MTGTKWAAQTAEPLEYVADLIDIAGTHPERRTLTDPHVAAKVVADETRSRIEAVLREIAGTPVVLLSGGVDSILVAAVAIQLGVRPHAITIVTDGDSDGAPAAAAAAALGLQHDVVRLTIEDVGHMAREVMRRLGTSELWEVTAGIPLFAARRILDQVTDVGPILTGSGADAIFGGGRRLTHPINSPAARDELDRLIRTESASNFKYQRLIPDFYPTLLDGYADRLVHVFQTVRWWQAVENFAPSALFGDHDGQLADKLAVRIACAELLPAAAKNLAWNAKSAIQRSSGLMGVLASSARRFAADLPGAQTYTDPMTEDPEAVATRLYLALLHG
ncbi:asparagine synthase-related protein [Nocardia gipuzkoensis]|uniref:asparagine synthase-related protein n=1 Tax=Nocardia gipuzkoensis TaxID=2749991 RepID=UPI00237EDC62|nr:asparagine synthase-related protein [Nocardia gipuzkoensis]MDE1674352.1 asparagine synthase-related protein [Nocardia gipuzkoensis]